MPKGGVRAGAGRKRKETTARQLANRERLLQCFSATDIRDLADKLKELVMAGNVEAMRLLLPYLFGGREAQLEAPTVPKVIINLPARWSLPEPDRGDR